MDKDTVVSVSDTEGNIYEATRARQGDPWDICYPTGQHRFHGTVPELRVEIKRTIEACGGIVEAK